MSATQGDQKRSDVIGSLSLAEQAVEVYMRLGAVMATEEQAQARLQVCESCEYRGRVFAPGVPDGVNGCTRCGCFLAVKSRVVRYFDPTKLKIKRAICPVGRWSDIDKNY